MYPIQIWAIAPLSVRERFNIPPLTKPVTSIYYIGVVTCYGFYIMPTPKGGRGQKAEYPTKVMRVPVALADTITTLCECYRDCGSDAFELSLRTIRQYHAKSAETRDWTKLKSLVTDIKSELPVGYLDHLYIRLDGSTAPDSEPNG